MIARICRPLANVNDVVPGGPHRAYGRRNNVRVREEAHPIRLRRYGPLRQRRR
jgi:hypothetical protein